MLNICLTIQTYDSTLWTFALFLLDFPVTYLQSQSLYDLHWSHTKNVFTLRRFPWLQTHPKSSLWQEVFSQQSSAQVHSSSSVSTKTVLSERKSILVFFFFICYLGLTNPPLFDFVSTTIKIRHAMIVRFISELILTCKSTNKEIY